MFSTIEKDSVDKSEFCTAEVRRKEFAIVCGTPRSKSWNIDRKDTKDVSIMIENESEEILQTTASPDKTNLYAAKKTVAQGMMDIALITANANQMRYLLEFNRNSQTFYISMFLISSSILLQIGIGVMLIFKGRLDFKGKDRKKTGRAVNNYVILGLFLVTVINVLIANFTTTAGEFSSNGTNEQC